MLQFALPRAVLPWLAFGELFALCRIASLQIAETVDHALRTDPMEHRALRSCQLSSKFPLFLLAEGSSQYSPPLVQPRASSYQRLILYVLDQF